PWSLIHVNRAKGQYRNDRLLLNTKSEDRLVFFQTFNGLYLTIDIHDENGKNAVYYRGECLRASLQDFLNVYSQGRDYLNDNMKWIDKDLAKQGTPPETLRDLFHDSPQPPKVRTSFARNEVKQVQDPPKPVAQNTSAPPFMPGSWTIVE
ncbi:MAG: hypothetical protein LBE91_06725, partial [Tannerella sp.]|nr:hypothetical protein [Tannerella sp.]